MPNRCEAELALHQGILNGRHWTTLRRPDAIGFEISEITRLPVSGTPAYFPGHWSGKSERAAEFALLDKAAGKRRNGACLPRYSREMRNIWFGRARQNLVLSRQKREAVEEGYAEVEASSLEEAQKLAAKLKDCDFCWDGGVSIDNNLSVKTVEPIP